MDIKIPKALVEDHKEFQTELEKIVKEGGKSGQEALALLDIMNLHIEHEEKYALPPLSLLPALTLASGELDFEMAEAVEMAETLKKEMPRMLAEHRAILAALKKLADAAQEEGKSGCLEIIEWIKFHVKEEEEIYYPAALLVGAFLKIKLATVFNFSFP